MSKLGTSLILKLNKLFKQPSHPFNLENDGIMDYSTWEFNNAQKSLDCFSNKYNLNDILQDKIVLDLGCGGGGKSVFYSQNGAKYVYGIDINPNFISKANKYVKDLNLQSNIEFIVADACCIPLEDKSVDVVIMNDFFEHVSSPEKALDESLRVLKNGGKIFINFPPYSHPWGEHLNDAINIPWVHYFFSEDSMINAYLYLIKDKPDFEERKNLRFTNDRFGKLHNTYINKMTKRKAKNIFRNDKYTIEYKEYLPLRNSVKSITKTTGLLTGMCVYVLRKDEK